MEELLIESSTRSVEKIRFFFSGGGDVSLEEFVSSNSKLVVLRDKDVCCGGS